MIGARRSHYRWIAALTCADAARPHAAWFAPDADVALGLAVLADRAHVVFGPAPNGQNRFWPGSPPDFALADGAWLLRPPSAEAPSALP